MRVATSTLYEHASGRERAKGRKGERAKCRKAEMPKGRKANMEKQRGLLWTTGKALEFDSESLDYIVYTCRSFLELAKSKKIYAAVRYGTDAPQKNKSKKDTHSVPGVHSVHSVHSAN